MLLVLLRDWRGYRSGRTFDMPDGAANVLLRRGLAAVAAEAAQKPTKRAAKPAAKPKAKKR